MELGGCGGSGGKGGGGGGGGKKRRACAGRESFGAGLMVRESAFASAGWAAKCTSAHPKPISANSVQQEASAKHARCCGESQAPGCVSL